MSRPTLPRSTPRSDPAGGAGTDPPRGSEVPRRGGGATETMDDGAGASAVAAAARRLAAGVTALASRTRQGLADRQVARDDERTQCAGSSTGTGTGTAVGDAPGRAPAGASERTRRGLRGRSAAGQGPSTGRRVLQVRGRSADGRAATPRVQGPVVSLNSVRGLARRARQRRLSRRVGIGLIVACLLAVLAGYAFFFSPWLAVKNVRLIGGDRFGSTQVEAATAAEVGRPLALVGTSELERTISAEPAVKSVRVVRVWPSTLEVRVTERVPVLAVPVVAAEADEAAAAGDSISGDEAAGAEESAGGYQLMAADGVVVETVAELPERLAATDADTVAAGPEAVEATAAVMAALPVGLQNKVTTIRANSRDSVLFSMVVPVSDDKLDLTDASTPTAAADGEEPTTREVTVVWGSVDESALKAEVLVALLQTDAKVYDVSSPSTPVTRDGTSGTPTLDDLATENGTTEPDDDRDPTPSASPTSAPTTSTAAPTTSTSSSSLGAATPVAPTSAAAGDAATPVP